MLGWWVVQNIKLLIVNSFTKIQDSKVWVTGYMQYPKYDILLAYVIGLDTAKLNMSTRHKTQNI